MPTMCQAFCSVNKYRECSAREYASHSKHPLTTTQEMTVHLDITRWSILKSDCILCSQR